MSSNKFPSFPDIKGVFPFSIGTTSYVLPNDILPNVEFLYKKIDEMELVLFEGKGYSNLPSKDNIKLLKSYDLNYNIHMPIDIKLITNEDNQYYDSIKILKYVYELTLNLKPVTYTIHIDPLCPETIAIFEKRKKQIINDFNNIFISHNQICIENLNEYFPLISDEFIQNNYSVCMDIGHILKKSPPYLWEKNIIYFFDKYEKYIKIIHLHGIINNKDHHTIKNIPENIIKLIINKAKKLKISVILEIFYYEDIIESINILKGLI